MTGHDWTVVFTVGTAVMVLVCALAALLRKRALEIFAAAGMIAVFTFASRIVSYYTDMPWSAAIWPVQDAICVLLAWGLWRVQREWWKAGLAICFAVQCAAHVAYWWFVLTAGASRDLTVAYLWIINPIFGVVVSILTLAGGRHVAGHILDLTRLFWDGAGHRSPAFRRW